ncbi:MAG: hypothetical protein ABIO44_07795 [Saprospiraceae bacterium]
MRLLSKYCLSLLILGLLFTNLEAQSSKKVTKKNSKDKSEHNFWKEDMWYGGGFNLAFHTEYIGSIPGNIFEFGISPLAGYKIKSWWSIGPRLEFDYIGGRFDDNPDVLKLNGFNFGLGAFSRAKFLTNFFGHVEYSSISTLSVTGLVVNKKIQTQRDFKDHFFTGIGYNPEGTFSYEIYLLYDFLADKESVQLPIQFRAGFTYNF